MKRLHGSCEPQNEDKGGFAVRCVGIYLTTTSFSKKVLAFHQCPIGSRTRFLCTAELPSQGETMRRHIGPKSEKRRGAALVETAIVLPVFFLVVLGIIEFGRAFMVMQLVNTAAREAARSAISDGTNNEEVKAMVEDLVANTVSVTRDKVMFDVEITEYPGNPETSDEIANAHKRDTIKIDVSVDFAHTSFITPQLPRVRDH